MHQVDSHNIYVCIICPTGITTRYIGNVYVVDTDSNRIRKVTVSTGIITTIAGSSTNAGFNGDNAATSSMLKYPSGVAVDSSGKQSLFLGFFCVISSF